MARAHGLCARKRSCSRASPAALAAVIVAIAVLSPRRSLSAGFDGSQNLDIYQGPLVSSGRITGLAGAYVGLAEGQDGEPFNVAALAQRDRFLDRAWDWDLVFATLLPTIRDLKTTDFDNDGRPEENLLGRTVVHIGLSLQIKRLGIGLLIRDHTMVSGVQSYRVDLHAQDVALGAAYAFGHETLIAGAELVLGGTLIEIFDRPDRPQGTPVKRSVDYHGARFRPGALWRPRGRSFRVGVQLDPGLLVGPTASRGSAPGVAVPRGVSMPAMLRIGAARWFGPNADHLNAPCPQTVREERTASRAEKATLPKNVTGFEDTVLRPLMVTAELDVIGASPDAIALGDFFRQGKGELSRRAGENADVSLHVGAEWEAVAGWIITRGGAYLEPSRLLNGPRPHVTFGLEGKIPFWPASLRLAVSGDVAPRYQNIAFSLGLWKSIGPEVPAALSR
jgi:hypothetical protein